MKVLVIGLGSMGKRRVRLLKQIDGTIEIVGVDFREDRCKEAEELYSITAYSDLEQAFFTSCGAAFICTAPLTHSELITKCLEQGLHVFSEINLVLDGYQKNIELAAKKDRVLFLSSTFNYREEIQYIQSQVKESKSMISYSYHIGQYLPDWHPWESYKDYFIGNSKTDGCREIMAIELPWLYKTFGAIKDVHVKKNKKTSLQITFPDSYLILIEHESGVQGSLLVDVVSRKAVRNLEIFGEDLYLSWDGSPSGLKKYDIEAREDCRINLYEKADHENGYAAFVVENAYRNEIKAFLNQIREGEMPKYTFDEDIQILSIIDQIEGGAIC